MYERHSVRSAFLYGYFGRKEMKTMIDFSILVDYFVLVVVMACLIVGHIIKTALDFIPNKYKHLFWLKEDDLFQEQI